MMAKAQEWDVLTARNIQEVENLRSVWEGMQNDESFPILNAEIDGYLTTVATLEDVERPHVILLSRNGAPRALLIGRIEKKRIPCRIGYKTLFNPMLRSLSIVHGGVLGSPGPEGSTVLVQELMNTLEAGDADMVYFNHLRTDSAMYSACKTIPDFLCGDKYVVSQPHWLIRLPDNAETFRKNLSQSRRRYVKRYTKALTEACGGSVEVKTYCSQDDIGHITKVASKISSGTYKNALGVGFSDDSVTRSLMRLYTEKGWWRAYILYAGGKPCAVEYGARFGDTFFGRDICYDPSLRSCSPGTVLFIKVLECLADDAEIKKFDIGYGAADYKARFGTDHWPEAVVYIYAPRFYPICINLVKTLTVVLAQGLESVLRRMNFVNKIKKRWRDRLRKKLET